MESRKKNILLVIPKGILPNETWEMLPIGIMYVSSSLKKSGIPTYCLNLIGEERDEYEILKEYIEKYEIDIVATGGLVVNHQEMKVITDCVKRLNENIVTIIGGGLVTHSPEEAMEIIITADYGVLGEGEITDVELIKAIESRRDIEQVKGIIFRKENSLIMSEPRPDIKDLDTLPWPDYEGFQYFKVLKKVSSTHKIIAPITTSRSCPFQCTYCTKSGGGNYRQRSLDSVFEEVDYLISKYEVDHFILNDELFAYKSERVSEFCQRISEKNVTWEISLRIGPNITIELLEKMKKAGCNRVQYGLESACDKVLKSMKKGTTKAEMLRVLEITKDIGIVMQGCFIFGDTAETVETVQETLDFIYQYAELMPETGISPILLFPGSALYDKAVSDKKIQSSKDFIEQGLPLTNFSAMSDEEYFQMVHSTLPSFAVAFRLKIQENNEDAENYKITCNSPTEYQLTYTCKHCKKVNEFQLQPKDLVTWYGYCQECACSHTNFPFFFYFQSFQEKFKELILSTKSVIWGTGGVFQGFYTCNPWITEENVILIDNDKRKQKLGVNEMQVFAPEYLENRDIDTVILCVYSYSALQLERFIKINYPKIKKVLWVFEVGLEDKKISAKKNDSC